MRIFQIGAAGNIGRRLSPILVERGDEVTGMHRSPEQATTISDSGAKPVTGDLISDSVESLAAKMAGHDAVVFSAGAHGTGREKTTLIDGKGLEKAADAARLAGATRFVLVSAFPESERSKGLGDDFEHYMRTKKTADVYLAATDLDWVIVRPGMLTEAPGGGRVSAGIAVEYGSVSRDDVAAVIDAVLHDALVNRLIIEVTEGTVPVSDAVATLAAR
ncbi:NAD(P)-binding oxidoreductase [Microbacterium sp. 22215]|uniref:NAD(P)-binding oxidoreductase n=1 Tax=Microbacterium sp. 22215 TaxID=3453893 RepID=UPI003F8500A4